MQREGSACLVVLQQICSTKEESDLLLRLKSVLNFTGMANGLHEERLDKTERMETGWGRQRGWGT